MLTFGLGKFSASHHSGRPPPRPAAPGAVGSVKKFNPDEPLRCSFWHKTQKQVEKLISSPSDYPRAYICNECVNVCQTILEDEKREQATSPTKRLPRPPEIKQFLDAYVIGQDRTKKKLAVAGYNQYKRLFLNNEP